jgi:RNA methyltransferase, TrmH family
MKNAFAHVLVTTIKLVLQHMLSKAQSKHIRSLTHQKFRSELGLFVAEGHKVAAEWLDSTSPVHTIICTENWAAANEAKIAAHPEAEVHRVKEHELAALSSLHTPNQVLLVLPFPAAKSIPTTGGWYIALDDLQDPGNLGTIIRIADWYGIQHIICSPGSVDAYNPKVVQSAMGGHLRVNIYTAALTEILPKLDIPKYAATLNGTNVYDVATGAMGVLIIGNESKGISEAVAALATQQVTIPRKGGAESLNAGVSAGILCALLLPR